MNEIHASTVTELGKEFGLWINDLKSPKRKPRKGTPRKKTVTGLLHLDKVERFRAQREHFWPIQDETHARLERSISRLCRGQQVVKNAMRWEEPYVGTGRTETDRIRGEQWRLVMAWSGLEMIIVDLVKSKEMQSIEHYVNKLKDHKALENYEPIQFKTSTVKLKQYGEIINGQIDIMDFLDVIGKDTKNILKRFFQERDTFLKPYEGLVIAKSLRHMIAHGSLSSSKVKEWELRPLFNRLTTEIGQITALTFQTLNGI